MAERLVSINGEYAVILPEALLSSLGITPETDLLVEKDGDAIVIRKAEAEQRGRKARPLPKMPAPKEHRYGFPKKEPW